MKNNEMVWQINSKVRFRRVFEEAVVIHQEKSEALVLNEVGVSFLEMCDGERNVQQIIDLMAVQYDIELDVLTRDVHDFVVELSENGLITPA